MSGPFGNVNISLKIILLIKKKTLAKMKLVLKLAQLVLNLNR